MNIWRKMFGYPPGTRAIRNNSEPLKEQIQAPKEPTILSRLTPETITSSIIYLIAYLLLMFTEPNIIRSSIILVLAASGMTTGYFLGRRVQK